MFKNALILAILLLLCSTVFSVRLIEPLSKELSSSERNFVGVVPVGNTIKLIFSKELVDKYESLEMVSVLPTGFDYSVKNELESLKLLISVPKNAPLGEYDFTIVLSGSNRNDKVDIYFNVVKGVLDVFPPSSVEKTVFVDGVVEYKLRFVNDKSDADAVFIVKPDLPANWISSNKFIRAIEPIEVIVPKRESVEESFFVYPRLEGAKEFLVNIYYEDAVKSIPFKVNSKPTLKSKLESAMYGFPFFSFSLAPSYFFNSLFSFFIS